MENEVTQKKKKKLSPLIVVVIILILFALVLCIGVVGLWLVGKNAMTQVSSTPELPTQEHQVVTSENNENYIYYNNKRYEYNQQIINILLLGIDSPDMPDETAITQDQADVLILATLDQKNNKLTLINLPRDTMCDVGLSDNEDGSHVVNAQLALSYAYRNSPHESCELTRDTVSNLFFGLPIQGYGAYYLSGITELNDAVGGVTVTVIGDVDFPQQASYLKRLTDGNVVTLKWYEVQPYIQSRNPNLVNANELRMVRQKQYMLALLSQAKEMLLDQPASLFTMYDAVDDYLVTNLDVSAISYLATLASKMEFSQDVRSLSGEYRLNTTTNNAELYVDQQKLQDLIIDVFYTEVP